MPLKILVADDSATMRKIMEMTFAGEDADVVTVANGDACVRAAAEISPDLVFADLSMSGMDGYGVSVAIKSQAALANTAVIVMASQHHAFDEARGQDAGVDDHVIKPFDTQSVIDKVAEVLKRPRMIPAGGAPAPGPGAHPYRDVAAAPPPPPQQQAKKAKSTVAFGGERPQPPPARPQPPPPPARPAPPERPVLQLADEAPAPPTPAARPQSRPPAAPIAAATAAATSSGGDLARKLDSLGLSPAQLEGVLALSREVIEQVVWEVVPDLAETIIREELRRLTE